MTLTVEFATDLIPLNEARRCDKCKEWTWWAAPKQRTLGRCPTCQPGYWIAPTTEDQLRKAVLDVLDAFEGAEIASYDTGAEPIDAATFVPERHELNVTVTWLLGSQTPRRYTASVIDLSVGPCVGCHRTIRRYGPDGQTHCRDCHIALERERYYAAHPDERVTDEFSDQVKRAGL